MIFGVFVIVITFDNPSSDLDGQCQDHGDTDHQFCKMFFFLCHTPNTNFSYTPVLGLGSL